MRDYFKTERCKDKFLRRECPNKVARQRAKRELREAVQNEKKDR